jgi:hypothetical protein
MSEASTELDDLKAFNEFLRLLLKDRDAIIDRAATILSGGLVAARIGPVNRLEDVLGHLDRACQDAYTVLDAARAGAAR